jgi:Type I phosphodiesterase / nucleotide pyrophosphatase/Sulfatase
MNLLARLRRFASDHFEDVTVRVMYFTTTIDSFVVCAAVATIALFYLRHSITPNWFAAISGSAVVYAAFKIADFYPTFILFFPVFGIFLARVSGFSFGSLGLLCLINCGLAAIVQLVFQDTPHMVASRDLSVPLRMFVNSFVTLAPTTLSLPVSGAYALLLSATAYYHPVLWHVPYAAGYYAVILLAAGWVRWLRPKTFVPASHQPRNQKPISHRVVVLNLDGFSLHAFRRANMPFLKKMAEAYAVAPEGAMTVYRALTNPAFASIITGAPPSVHGVSNNNFGQSIRVDGLPDVVSARLYGSVHVRHFSKPNWKVRWFSLVTLGAERTEEVVFETLKQDILNEPDTRLFIVDISETDFIGHSYGTYSRQYLRAGDKADKLIENFCSWLKEHRLYDDFTLIASSDHGMFITDHSYLLSKQEIYTPLIFFGANIAPQSKISGKVSIMDINANVSYILGVPYNSRSVGRVFKSIYNHEGGKQSAAATKTLAGTKTGAI